MTEVLQSPSSSSSPSISTPTHNHNHALFQPYGGDEVGARMREEEEVREKRDNERRDQLSVLALLVALFRKSFWVTCKTGTDGFSTAGGMEIGWPTDVQHVNHVTFDRFDGFLGLPVEFEPEVPRRAPSARYILLLIMLCLFNCYTACWLLLYYIIQWKWFEKLSLW